MFSSGGVNDGMGFLGRKSGFRRLCQIAEAQLTEEGGLLLGAHAYKQQKSDDRDKSHLGFGEAAFVLNELKWRSEALLWLNNVRRITFVRD